ncbi:hypothetical protein ETAA1_54600 [Urbifossiella limnaea]|uniref:Uncharacterized protein n=1 Tax=Urbifossiella limnaea TaxID=2528023 RepID=A0A517Y139_9BACT|nr:hypothetical protein ETAA1_54600 [Urbifossiella limnaea]
MTYPTAIGIRQSSFARRAGAPAPGFSSHASGEGDPSFLNQPRIGITMRLIVTTVVCFSVGVYVLLAAPIPDAARPFTLPHTIGTKWTYRVKGSDEKLTMVVTDIVSDKEHGNLVTVSYRSTKGEPGIWEIVSLDGRQLLVHQQGPFECVPPIPWIRTPYLQHDKWVVQYTLSTSSSSFDYAAQFVQGPVARVEVPAGKFEAVRVHAIREGFGRGARTRWYANGVGVVKEVEKGGDTLELVSFEPGQKPR